MTKWVLFGALGRDGGIKTLISSASHGELSMVVCGVEREDGSGQSFNVTGYVGDGISRRRITVYVRTID